VTRVSLGLALLGAILFAGCGGVTLPDLFIVQRSGSVPGARLTLLVNEGGTAHCNGAHAVSLSDPQIVQARAIQEELHDPATQRLVLAPKAGSTLSYYVRDPEGTVRFSDNSAHQPPVLHRLALFVLQVAQGACHLPL
jgi:hypothetical protein